MKKLFLKIIKRLKCKHKLEVGRHYAYEERTVPFDIWSSETGYEIKKRRVEYCACCGAKVKKNHWILFKRYGYGGMEYYSEQ